MTFFGAISVCKSNNFEKSKTKSSICIPESYLKSKSIELKYWEKGLKCNSFSGLSINISDLYNDNKFSLFKKERYPIIFNEGKVIWIPKLLHGNIDRIKRTKPIIKMIWNPIYD